MSSLLVAAIDFGTTYSGWAYSCNHDFESEPTKVFSKLWIGGQLTTQKAPTCVLIHPDGKTFHSFGYDAEKKYYELTEDKCHHQWFFFKRFKMKLYNEISIQRDFILEDATGKKIAAKIVFEATIRYLKDDLIRTIKTRFVGIKDSDIHWVLTVPAIWNDAAKQFMREAAECAGILGDRLSIALEPEAVALFCRLLPTEKILGRDKISLAKFKAGTRYLVLDAGGGTVDFTVHEIKRSGDLQELYTASGGAWGATTVDDAFEQFLVQIVGTKAIEKLREEHMEDYIELFRDFEFKKRETTPSTESKITVRLPLVFIEIVKETTGKKLKDCISVLRYKDQLNLTGDKLRIDISLMKGFFIKPLRSVLEHVEKLLSKVAGVSAIIMAGGFSESQMLQYHIQKKFPATKVIIPEETGLAVLKGAVIFGHSPKKIAERVCRFTYGRKTTHLASSACKHPKLYTGLDEYHNLRCYNNFTIHARIGQTVKVGQEEEEVVSTPVYDDQDAIIYEIYASSKPDPIFVTDPECTRIGRFSVAINDTSLGRNRKFGVRFIFGDTEIKVKIIDKATGKEFTKHVDFLGRDKT